LLDDISKERNFDKGNEKLSITEFENQDTVYIDLYFSEIQGLDIFKCGSKNQHRLHICFETEGFRVQIHTDIIQASELHNLAHFVEKDDVERLEGKKK